MLAVIWVVSFIMEMPNFFGWGDHVYDKKSRICVWDSTADRSYTYFVAFVGILLPIIITSIFYTRIFFFVRKQKHKVTGNQFGSQQHAAQQRHHTKLAVTLFVIFVVFTCCWAPYAIIIVADVKDTFPLEWHLFSSLISHLNSSLNVLLYGLTNGEFRKGYWSLIRGSLRKCGCLRNGNVDESKSQEITLQTRKKEESHI